jgi:hypothetical protein
MYRQVFHNDVADSVEERPESMLAVIEIQRLRLAFGRECRFNENKYV